MKIGDDMVEKIIQYENGDMSMDEIISFFQELIDSGLAKKILGE